MKYILGIDIGTGSTKAVALGLSFRPVASSQRAYSTFSGLPGYSEQDPLAIWEAFVSCLNEIIDLMGCVPEVIGLSSAMHSVIAVNENGEAISPVITWADTRSAAIAERLLEGNEGHRIYTATGTPVHAMSPLCKLIWIRENQNELFNSASRFISIKEYIWYRLFGEYRVDHSIASCTGLFDIRAMKWHGPALKMAGIDAGKLSEPVGTSYTKKGLSGDASMFSMLNETPFVIGASDGCLANLGSHAIEPGVAAITIGTSGAVRIADRLPASGPEMNFSYLLDEQTYICGGPVNNGGIAIHWLLKNVFGKSELRAEDYETFFNQVRSVPAGSEGLIFLPYLSGERSPIWNAEARGSFFGLCLRHGQGHLGRAVLEGICYALNHVLVTLEKTSVKVNRINVSGGFVHSEVWMQILADITGKTLSLMHTEDASAIGAAYLSARAARLSAGYPQPACQEKLITPDAAAHIRYRAGFSQYTQLYPALQRLNETRH